MKTMWCAWWDEIKPVDVVSETDNFITIREKCPGGYKGRRKAKASSYENYFDNWDAAHNFLATKAAQELAWAEEKLERARLKLQKINAMKPPESTCTTQR